MPNGQSGGYHPELCTECEQKERTISNMKSVLRACKKTLEPFRLDERWGDDVQNALLQIELIGERCGVIE